MGLHQKIQLINGFITRTANLIISRIYREYIGQRIYRTAIYIFRIIPIKIIIQF